MYRLFREELVQTYVLPSFSPIDIERVVLRPCLLAGLSVREWYRCFFSSGGFARYEQAERMVDVNGFSFYP